MKLTTGVNFINNLSSYKILAPKKKREGSRKMLLKLTPGLILPNFVRQVKSCRHTALGMKNCCSISPTFCHLKLMNFAKPLCWISPNDCPKFWQICAPFNKFVQQKGFSFRLREKAAKIYWWNRPQKGKCDKFFKGQKQWIRRYHRTLISLISNRYS